MPSLSFPDSRRARDQVAVLAKRDLRLPKWSVILPLRTRMTSTVSKWILRPVGANPQNVPLCVPWYVLNVVTRSPSEICQWISA